MYYGCLQHWGSSQYAGQFDSAAWVQVFSSHRFASIPKPGSVFGWPPRTVAGNIRTAGMLGVVKSGKVVGLNLDIYFKSLKVIGNWQVILPYCKDEEMKFSSLQSLQSWRHITMIVILLLYIIYKYVFMMIIMLRWWLSLLSLYLYSSQAPNPTSPVSETQRRFRNTWQQRLAFGLLRCCRTSDRRALVQMISLMKEIRPNSWYGKRIIIYKVLYIPGGVDFLLSIVWLFV